MCASTGQSNEAALVGTGARRHWCCRLEHSLYPLLLEHEMKISELTGAALDWAVAKCKNHALTLDTFLSEWERYNCAASIDWAQAGPIIEREWIDLHCVNDSLWEAEINANEYHNRKNGPTPLIAAMRCYVASVLGDEVEVPDGL